MPPGGRGRSSASRPRPARPAGSGSTPAAMPRPAPHGSDARLPDADRRQAGPVHQPVLLARPRLDGPAPDRPGRVAGGAGLRVPRAVRPRAATSRASPGRRPTRSTNGVHIHRVPATSLGRRSTWARMTDYLSFYAGAVVKALLLPRFDAVVTLTTPPIIGLIGTLLQAAQGIAARLLEHGPPSRRQPGARADVAAQACCRPADVWLSGFVYRQADQVVVLGPYMADRIALKGVAPDRIATIPVWSRRDEIYPTPARRQPAAQVARARATRSWRCTRETSAWPTRSTSSSRRPGGSATAPTSSSCSSATGRGWPRSRPRASARGLTNIRLARLRPARPVARLALAGRRPPDLDAARDDRDRRARQALRRDGRRPAGRLRRPRALRVGRHDPRRRLRHHRHARRRRRPGRRARAPGCRPEPGPAHGRTGTLGVPRDLRAKTLLQPLARADRRTRSLDRRASRRRSTATVRDGASTHRAPPRRCLSRVSR